MTLIINGKTYEAGELIAYVENLEKENTELKDYNKKLLQSDIDKHNKICLLSQKVNDLQKKNAELDCQKNRNKACYSCVNATERCFTNEIGCPCEGYKSYKDENAELRKIAEFQQSSNMNTHLENKKLKEGLTVGSMWNKHLNSQNKALEEEMDRYRNMVFEKDEQLTNAKELIRTLLLVADNKVSQMEFQLCIADAKEFLKYSEVEK